MDFSHGVHYQPDIFFQVLNDMMSSMESVENDYLMPNSREFLLVQSHLSSGEPNKALYCFMKAFGGIEKGMNIN